MKLDRSADIDEAAIGDRTADPADLVLQLGLAKAEALLPGLKAEAGNGSLGAALLLTGDQGVYESMIHSFTYLLQCIWVQRYTNSVC